MTDTAGTALWDIWYSPEPWWVRPAEPLAPPKPGDGIKALRAAVRSTKPVDEPRPLETRLLPRDERRKGRPRRGRLPRGARH